LAFLCGGAVFLVCYLTLCVRLRTLRAEEFELIAHLIARLGRPGASLSRHIAALGRFALPV